MSSLTQQIFSFICSKIGSSQRLTDDTIEDLFGLFGESLLEVLPMLDGKHVKKLVTPSGRFLYRVHSAKGATTTSKAGQKNNKKVTDVVIDYNYCWPVGGMCNCTQFKFDGCKMDKFLWCKHLLATKIAAAICAYETCTVDEEEFSDICKCHLLSGIYI